MVAARNAFGFPGSSKPPYPDWFLTSACSVSQFGAYDNSFSICWNMGLILWQSILSIFTGGNSIQTKYN